tara:strand:- start:500 stop:763 length:264 start_codon:yes stop_codon:yes gene_type:complete
MSLLKICNNCNADQYFYIDKDNANKLEVVFNLTEKGKEWREIGDVLYDFSIGKEVELNWNISKEQFNNIRLLANNNKIKKIMHQNDN